MNALAFDFNYHEDGVEPAQCSKPQRRLYAVRGTVGDALPGPATAAGGATAVSFARPRKEPRLDVLIGGAWEALAGGTSSACPMCPEGALVPRRTAAADIGAAGGRCSSCGTTIE